MLGGRAAHVCTLGILLASVVFGRGAAVCQEHPASPQGSTRAKAQVAAPAVPPAAPSAPPAEVTTPETGKLLGLPVREIQFQGVSERPEVLSHLRELVAQKPDEPLDKQKIRRSLQALHATGRFSEIQVEANRTPQNEISLVFVAKENLFLGPVTVTGAPKRPTPNQLINASKLQMGELFTAEKVERAMERMKRVLEDNGYYKSTITGREEVRPKNQQVDVFFHIEPGPRARVGNVVIEGTPGYTPEQIRSIADLHPGDTVTADGIGQSLQRLRKRYQKRNRLEAQVSITNRTYNPDPNTVDYTLKIERGPTVDIHVRGARLRRGLVKKYVPVYEENAVDEDLLNEGRRNIRDYFQTKGYFDVEVAVSQQYDAKADHLHIIYQIERSDKHKLVDLVIEGNKYFDTGTIRERMAVQPAGWLLIQGRYSQALLARDVDAIANLYRSNGFQQVKVTPEVQDDYRGVNGHLRVVIRIEEGPQTRVASLEVLGNQTIGDEEIRGMLNTIEGQPFSDFNVATDRETILSYYFNEGFPNVQFESAARPEKNDVTRMHVTFTINEGPQVFVDRVLLSGLEFTRPFVTRRELQIRGGDPLSQQDMLESQRRLYDLGIFNEVNMAVQNPDGNARHKNLMLNMREAKRWTFNYGLGFEVQTGSTPVDVERLSSEQGGLRTPSPTTPTVTPPSQGRTGFSPRVSFDVTRLNFRGRDHTIVFKSRFGRLQQRALASYNAPRWFSKKDLQLTFSTFFDNSRDVRTFTSERLEGSLQAEQVWSRNLVGTAITTTLYRYSYRRVKVDPNTLVIDPNLIPLFSKPVRVGMPSFTYIRDKRDDPLDTHKGNYTTFDSGLAAGFFGSEASFGRFLIQNSNYELFKRKWVFARSTRLGIEEPFGASKIIPLPERFFAGGGNSHRGFAINQAGPRDLQTGFPVGGNAIFINNMELRFPPVLLPFVKDNLSFVMFHDAGNVFDTSQEMLNSLLRWHQKTRQGCASLDSGQECNFNYLSHAVGAGVRYRTPIGPVRVDLGYNLNPTRFAVRAGENPHTETLKRWNVFFSIGQTF